MTSKSFTAFFMGYRLLLLRHKIFLKVLRDIDDKVAHAFKRIDNVDIIHTGLVILLTAVNTFNFRITQIGAQIVDTVFRIIGIGNVMQLAVVCQF